MKMFLEEGLYQVYYVFGSPASLETSFRPVSKLGKQGRVAELRLNGGYGSSSSEYGGSSSGYGGSSGGYSTSSAYGATSGEVPEGDSWNWNDSFRSDARNYGKGVDPDIEKAGNEKRISRLESESLNRDFKQLVSEGWSVGVTHEGRGYSQNSFGDITVYSLYTPDGRNTDTFYDMNNDGVIDYAK
ncbi:hypothetical protein [Treponema brennaborense]|uniref:Uncharacterized protein n=1 Tax=Treponema brennaborense (strain DSM 12168 / CIP 105900 / DD5/3) TaxID=906968 RepID=F4LKB8_TREBD|nr:hypothetical protein [Treponema brennaborense]AEE16492.1 hypothetical protein Trebr_1060 [Treponema brennaborense DSM 12168]